MWQVQEIASKGGKTQNAGEEPSPKKSKSEEAEHKSNDSDKSDSGKGKQGFASMPKEKVEFVVITIDDVIMTCVTGARDSI